MSRNTRPHLTRPPLKLAGALLFSSLLFICGNAWAAGYKVVELVTLMQGHPATAHGPNLVGTGVGGGVVIGSRVVGRPQALLLVNGAFQGIAGLPNSDYTLGFGINDAGAVVGSSNTATAVRGFFTSRSGNARELPPLPGDTGSTAFAVNNSSEAVGFSSGPAGEHAVIWRLNGATIALQSEPGTMERALAINDRSDIAGVVDNSGSRVAVVWRRAGPLQELDMLPQFILSEPSAINSAGDVVGFSQNLAGERRATLWPANGGAINLGTFPGGSFSQAFGINNRGDVVGTSGSNAGNRAFIWTAAAGFKDLNSLIGPSSFVLTAAVGINNAGMIIATGHDAGVETHEEHEAPIRVFLLKP